MKNKLMLMVVSVFGLMAVSAPVANAGKATSPSWLYNPNGSSVPTAVYLDHVYGKLVGNIDWFENGRKVTMWCWTDSQYYPPKGTYAYKSKRFFYVDISLDHGLVHGQFWVHSSYVTYQQTVSHC